MKKLLAIMSLISLLTSSFASSVYVKSGSKYPIILAIFDVTGQCNQEDALRALEKAEKDMPKLNLGEKIKQGFKMVGIAGKAIFESVKEDLRIGGCAEAKSTGGVVLKRKGDGMILNKKFLVVAFKDPVLAWEKHKKIVNPFPTIFITSGRSITLKTIKAKKGVFFGLKGDFGLIPVFSK